MRLLAWSRKLSERKTSKGKSWVRIERFDCSAHCKDGADVRARTLRGCTRTDLLPVPWDVDLSKLSSEGWMGRAPRPRGTKGPYPREVPQYPFEDPHEGCPGGWYRSRFVASLLPFLRTRTEGGGRVSNPLLDRCDDELVIQCVLLLEREQDAFEANAVQVIHG